MNEEISNF